VSERVAAILSRQRFMRDIARRAKPADSRLEVLQRCLPVSLRLARGAASKREAEVVSREAPVPWVPLERSHLKGGLEMLNGFAELGRHGLYRRALRFAEAGTRFELRDLDER
jgi:hypothetical protein